MSNLVEKKSIFKGMTMSQMKDAYSKMTAKERGQYAGAFVRAAKTAKKPAAKKTTKATSSSQKPQTPTKTKPTAAKPTASDKAVKGGYTISPEKRKPGTRGAAVQPKAKPKLRRGSGVKKTGKKIDLGKTLKNLSDKFKLTRKAGEVFTVGNMRYVSDGKGGIRSSQRIR
jgi:hypothetical protein